MKKMVVSRKKLGWLSAISLVLGAALLVAGVLVINFGSKMKNTTSVVLMCIGGALLLLAGFLGLVFGFIALFTTMAMIKTFGSQRDDNIALKGTENAKLCPNCGHVLEGEFCTNCGKSAKGKICPKCKTENKQDARHCKNCGEEL